jgi:hypothetical protein
LHQDRIGGHVARPLCDILYPNRIWVTGERKMARVIEFNWAEADIVVHPVQAVAVYPGQAGVIIRQQKSSERDRDDLITIPHHALGLFIGRLQSIHYGNTIEAVPDTSSELIDVYAVD